MDGWLEALLMFLLTVASLKFPGCLVNQKINNKIKNKKKLTAGEGIKMLGFWVIKKKKIKSQLTDPHEGPSEHLFIVQEAIKLIT